VRELSDGMGDLAVPGDDGERHTDLVGAALALLDDCVASSAETSVIAAGSGARSR
jgi:hypothetical protein